MQHNKTGTQSAHSQRILLECKNFKSLYEGKVKIFRSPIHFASMMHDYAEIQKALPEIDNDEILEQCRSELSFFKSELRQNYSLKELEWFKNHQQEYSWLKDFLS